MNIIITIIKYTLLVLGLAYALLMFAMMYFYI